MPFPKKVNVIVRLEFSLAYYNVTVQHVSDYATGNPHPSSSVATSEISPFFRHLRDVLLWIPTHGRAKAGRPARTYIQQLCENTGCCPEHLPRAMNDREEWRERVRDIRDTSVI